MDDPEFGALFFSHAKRVTRLAHLLGADDPEDVAQEAFCRLYSARRRLRDDQADAVAYLNRIAVNLVRSEQRRAQVSRRKAPLLAAAAVAPHSEADRISLLDELARLASRQREAVVLRYWADLSVAEIAAAMGTTPGTVKSQLSRGVAALSVALGEEAS